MPNTALVFTKNRDQVKIEELQLDLQAKRQQIAEMTLDLEDLKLEIRHFQKEYNDYILNWLLFVKRRWG